MPTIFTTNKNFGEWGEIFQDNVISAAIIDRVLHHCNVVKIIGESYRLKESKALFKKNELIKCTKSWSIYVHFISVINNGEYSRTMEVVTIFTSYAIIAIIFLIIALSFYKFIKRKNIKYN